MTDTPSPHTPLRFFRTPTRPHADTFLLLAETFLLKSLFGDPANEIEHRLMDITADI
jgi:hypothetical protein